MKKLLAIVVAAGLSWAGSAHAAVDYFLQIDTIKGESAQKNHKEWIEVGSFAWGVSNPATGGGGSSSGKATFSDFSWTQGLDAATVPIMLGVASGDRFRSTTFDAVKAGESQEPFFQMKFDEVVLTSLALSGNADSAGVAASLASAKITMTYWPQGADGRRGDPIIGTWDLTAGAPAAFRGNPQALYGLLLAAPTSFNVAGLPTANPQPVPEPQTWALFGLGLAGLAWAQRRRA